MTVRPPLLAAVLVVGSLSACGLSDPYASNHGSAPTAGSPPSASPRAIGGAPASGELSGRAPARLLERPTSFPGAAETPAETVRRAARLYGNWTSATAGRRLDRIAALSIGSARAELRRAAAQSGADAQQQGVRSSSTIEAVQLRGAGRHRSAVVVTRDQVHGRGLPDEGWRYHVTLAALERRGGRWVISRWALQP
jgi:hypothetical protein